MSVFGDFRAVGVDEDVVEYVGGFDVHADILIELSAVEGAQVLSLDAFGVGLNWDKTCGVHEIHTFLERFGVNYSTYLSGLHKVSEPVVKGVAAAE